MTGKHKIYCGDCLSILPTLGRVKCIFADPPDNIGLDYASYADDISQREYRLFLTRVVMKCVNVADVVWISFNARHTLDMASSVKSAIDYFGRFYSVDLDFKPCVQVFTFGQHRQSDLGNNHRPLWRIMRQGTPIYPDHIRVPSWRQRHGDKRADARGRVPGDVFDFPRVTGNSKQRRKWHPTQLHEGLVERCVLLSTLPGDCVIDPFGGTGTTARVCAATGRDSITIEQDRGYVDKIKECHGDGLTECDYLEACQTVAS